MTSEHRITPGLIRDILDALERHGYVRGGDLHDGRAAGLIGDLGRIDEGTQDHPSGPSTTGPPPGTRLLPPRPATRGIVVLSPSEARTVIAALDDASVCKRNRVEMRIDCDDRSCDSCQWRLRAAGTCDLLAADPDDAAQAWRAATHPSSARQPESAADREAGQ